MDAVNPCAVCGEAVPPDAPQGLCPRCLLIGPATPPRTAVVIPGYRIVRELSRGGQALVYLAVQECTGRRVAVKVMREGPLADERQRARFDREAQILAALAHPNIVGVLDRGETLDGSQYITMNYVDGLPLDEFTRRGAATPADSAPGGAVVPGPADPRETAVDPAEHLRLFLRVCDAVNAAHLRGVVHRDLKPSNILVDERGEPHVLDFGLARPTLDLSGVEDGAAPVTVTGQFLGSLPWASPEQAEGAGNKVDARSDVYSLGVILYQLLTGGRFPYKVVGTMAEVMDNIRRSHPTPPSKVVAQDGGAGKRHPTAKIRRSQINASVEAIVLKALSKSREHRYQSAGELGRDIGDYLSGKHVGAAAATDARSRRTRRILFVASGVLLLIAIALGIVVVRDRRTAARARVDVAQAVSPGAPSLRAQTGSIVGSGSTSQCGFEDLGNVVLTNATPSFSLASDAAALGDLKVTRLYFCKEDLIPADERMWAVRALNLWVPRRAGPCANLTISPAAPGGGGGATPNVLARVSRRLPDGVYCVHSGELKPAGPLPQFTATFVQGGIAKPVVTSARGVPAGAETRFECEIRNDGTGEFNEGRIVLTLQKVGPKRPEFKDRWELQTGPIPAGGTISVRKDFSSSDWVPGAYYFWGHLNYDHVYNDAVKFADIQTATWTIPPSSTP